MRTKTDREAPTWIVVVRCPNGDTTECASATEAQTYAEWGHCCVSASDHVIEWVQLAPTDVLHAAFGIGGVGS